MAAAIDDPDLARWRGVPGAKLHWRLWGDQYVVYNSGSANTHVLDAITAFVLHQVVERGYGTRELFRETRALLQLDDAEGFQRKLEATLRQLQELGLIEAVTP